LATFFLDFLSCSRLFPLIITLPIIGFNFRRVVKLRVS
jgi:hypothetical protein